MPVTGCHQQPLLDLQEKAFPVRSVPKSLQEAAVKSLELMRKEGASESDVMKAICGAWRKDYFQAVSTSH